MDPLKFIEVFTKYSKENLKECSQRFVHTHLYQHTAIGSILGQQHKGFIRAINNTTPVLYMQRSTDTINLTFKRLMDIYLNIFPMFYCYLPCFKRHILMSEGKSHAGSKQWQWHTTVTQAKF